MGTRKEKDYENRREENSYRNTLLAIKKTI